MGRMSPGRRGGCRSRTAGPSPSVQRVGGVDVGDGGAKKDLGMRRDTQKSVIRVSDTRQAAWRCDRCDMVTHQPTPASVLVVGHGVHAEMPL